jgi:outer membrane protein assembly factor BamB
MAGETKRRATVAALLSTLGLLPGGAVASPTIEDLVGIWAGETSHAGETAAVALHLERAPEGRLLIKLSAPAIHTIAASLGSVAPRIEGDQVHLGPFALTYDAAVGTLSGTIPEGLVPVHRLTMTLRRVPALAVAPRPELDAPVARPAWVFEAGAPLWAGLLWSAGGLFFGDDAGVLHALDAGTGKERWAYRTGGPIRAPAAVLGASLLVQSDDGFLYRLAAASGELEWKVRLLDAPVARLPVDDPRTRHDRTASAVTVADGRLFVGTHDGRLLALDPASGATLWSFAAGDSVLAAPAVADGRVLFGSYDGSVYALQAADGRLLWRHATGAPVVSTPAVDGRRVLVGSRSYDFLALDAQTGTPSWRRYFWFSWVESSAAVRDGVVYVGSSDAARLYALDAATGRSLWETDVRGTAWGQPAVTADRVLVGTEAQAGYIAPHSAGVLALDRATGRPVWRYPLPAAARGPYGVAQSPASGDGVAFFGALDGRVYAFRI